MQLSTAGRQFFEQSAASNDVLIRGQPMQLPDHTCVRCLDDYLVPVASPAFIARNRIQAPADCLGYPLLQVAWAMDSWPRWFDVAGVQVPTKLPGPTFDHHFLCLQAAMNDLGVALSPWSLLEEDIRADRLRPLFAKPRLGGAGVYALYRTDSRSAALAKEFIDWVGMQGNRVAT